MTFILVEDSFSMNQFSKFGINQGWILFVESINQGMILSAADSQWQLDHHYPFRKANL